MRTQKICFPNQQALCVFPGERSNLAQAISELRRNGGYPVIVLIGGEIEEQQAAVTRRAIQTLSRIAEDMNALVICGGTDMGVMAEIGQMRWQNRYKFPLVGITLEELVTWLGGPRSIRFMWWGKQRWQLESHSPISFLCPAASLGMSLPGLSVQQPSCPKGISL